ENFFARWTIGFPRDTERALKGTRRALIHPSFPHGVMRIRGGPNGPDLVSPFPFRLAPPRAKRRLADAARKGPGAAVGGFGCGGPRLTDCPGVAQPAGI